MASKNKHTPGPWKADDMVGKTIPIYATATTARGRVATVTKGDVRSSHDARLIAAAPDLLAACEAALAYVEDDSRSPRRRQAMRQGLRAAIAKAKGRAPGMTTELRLLSGKKTSEMGVEELRAAGEDAASCLDSFGGYGIPTDAHNAIVDLAFLLHEALSRLVQAEHQTHEGGLR